MATSVRRNREYQECLFDPADDNMSTIASRLKEAMRLRNMKQVDLVSLTGIGKSSISTYLSGDYVPKQRNIYKIAKALDVNEAWLMGKDVPMERKEFLEYFTVCAKENESFRLTAVEQMCRSFGTEYSHRSTHPCADKRKSAVLFYRAVDRRAAPQLSALIKIVEEMDFRELEKARHLISAYCKAGEPIKEIVDTALKPYEKEESEEDLLG